MQIGIRTKIQNSKNLPCRRVLKYRRQSAQRECEKFSMPNEMNNQGEHKMKEYQKRKYNTKPIAQIFYDDK